MAHTNLQATCATLTAAFPKNINAPKAKNIINIITNNISAIINTIFTIVELPANTINKPIPKAMYLITSMDILKLSLTLKFSDIP